MRAVVNESYGTPDPPSRPEPVPPTVPGYPVYPGNPMYPGYPVYPRYPVYAVPPRPRHPGAGTAITTVVLSFLGALSFAVLAVLRWMDVSKELKSACSYGSCHFEHWLYRELIGLLGAVTVVPILVTGAILLLCHRISGRWIVAGACGIALAYFVFSAMQGGFAGSLTYTIGWVGLFLIPFPIATLVLALVPPTGRWCRQRP